MRVIAKRQGFQGGYRRRVGSEFDMPERDMKAVKLSELKPVMHVVRKDEKAGTAVILPDWVVPASEASRKELANAANVEAERELKAIEAAAGPKRGGRPAVRTDADEGLV